MTPREKIAISHGKETILVYADEIMFIKSDGGYCTIQIDGMKPIMVSKSLKAICSRIKNDNFFRIHHGHIINIRFAQKFIEDKEEYVLLSDGSKHVVSRRKKSDFLAMFKKI